MFLYVGPNQVMPLSSALGAAAGLALVFWNKIVHASRKVIDLFSPRNAGKDDEEHV